jgi:hypothetical protein
MNEFEREKQEVEVFERELREAFARRPAPPSLRRSLMERRRRADAERPILRWPAWQKLAACLALTAILAGGLQWHIVEQRRKEEAARDQVLIALRITSRALNQMNARLAARRHAEEN